MAKKSAKTDTKKAIGVLAIIFGVLVIFNPALLAWVIGIYLIITGVLNVMG
tara:strand:+ start:1063 stop:1215 length:153 start_codon:yes stop_codon:yes gene_type:complete